MDIDNFEEVQLEVDTICDNCGYTIVKNSIIHQNHKDDLVYCSPCWDKVRNDDKSKFGLS